MKSNTASTVLKTVAKLKAERKAHVDAVTEIDGVFEQLGIKASVPAKRGPKPGKRKPGRPKGSKNVAKRKPGRPKGSKNVAKRKRGRPKKTASAKAKPGRPKKAKPAATKPASKKAASKKYAVTGQQLILNVVKAAGKEGAKTSAIVKAWEAQGRGSTANNTITELLQAKKIKRVKVKGKQGSVYRLA